MAATESRDSGRTCMCEKGGDQANTTKCHLANLSSWSDSCTFLVSLKLLRKEREKNLCRSLRPLKRLSKTEAAKDLWRLVKASYSLRGGGKHGLARGRAPDENRSVLTDRSASLPCQGSAPRGWAEVGGDPKAWAGQPLPWLTETEGNVGAPGSAVLEGLLGLRSLCLHCLPLAQEPTVGCAWAGRGVLGTRPDTHPHSAL